MIDSLEDNEVFIFGSNIHGFHAGGAAKQAHEQFGAEWGVGEGLTGKTYAFPTLDANMQKYSVKELESIRDAFYRCVKARPEMKFLLTKVGTGIAGIDEYVMIELFRDAPENVIKPKGWE